MLTFANIRYITLFFIFSTGMFSSEAASFQPYGGFGKNPLQEHTDRLRYGKFDPSQDKKKSPFFSYYGSRMSASGVAPLPLKRVLEN